MRRLLAAIGRLMSAMKTIWERCSKTGGLVARTVLATLAGGGGSVAAPMADEPPARSLAPQDGLAGIRRLAGAIAGDRVTEADLADIADEHIEWLATMDRGMLAKIMCADDAAIRAHMRGERSIRGVLAADAESVAAYRRRMQMSVNMTDEPAPEMAYAA